MGVFKDYQDLKHVLTVFDRHKGFVCDRDDFINRDHARDVLFGIGLVQHEGIISNMLYPDAL